jgi:hypothetical protein
MTAMSPAPLVLDELLDPAWLEAMLTPVGLVGGEKIDGVTVTEKLKTSATKVRFVVDTAGREIPLCVKGFFDSPLRQVAAAISQAEVQFYQEIAPTTELRLP